VQFRCKAQPQEQYNSSNILAGSTRKKVNKKYLRNLADWLTKQTMRQCIFCHKKADSKEHIWSKWILDLLPEAKDGIFTRVDREGKSHPRKAKKPEVTARVVCERNCNNGWMSTKLEGPMKALTEDIILINKKKTFSPEDCRHIAEWAFKTTVLANHIDLPEGEQPFFPEETRHAFAYDQSMPAGVYVWISRRNAGHLTATYRSIKRVQQPSGPLTPHLSRPPVSPYRFETYTCVFTIGYLLLQIVAARWTERQVRERLDFPTIRQAQSFENYASVVWPNNGFLVSWPPLLPVGNTLFESFWDRFNSFNLPEWMTP
jgi:hypothetical protein